MARPVSFEAAVPGPEGVDALPERDEPAAAPRPDEAQAAAVRDEADAASVRGEVRAAAVGCSSAAGHAVVAGEFGVAAEAVGVPVVVLMTTTMRRTTS